MRLLLIVASLLSFAFLTAARGEERIALVVANSSVANGPVLVTARNSAGLIADTLTRSGFEVTVVNDASGASFITALQDFVVALHAQPTAIGLFYYAGYAAQADGRNYLLPVDAAPASQAELAQQALPLDTILFVVENIARATIVILDTASGDVPRGAEPGLAPIDASASTVIALSSQPGTVAADGNGPTSAFAEAFAGALNEPGLDVNSVFARTRDRVAELTAGRQVPWVAGSLFLDAPVLNGGSTESAAESPSSPPSTISGAGEDEYEYPAAEQLPLDAPPGGSGGGSDYSASEPGWGSDFNSNFGSSSGGGTSDYSASQPDPGFYSAPGYSDQASGGAIDQSGMGDAERQRYEAEMAQRFQQEELARQQYEEALRAETERAVTQALSGAGAESQEQLPVPSDEATGEALGESEPPMVSGGGGIPGVSDVFTPPSYPATPGLDGTLGAVPYPPTPAIEPAPEGSAASMDNLGGMYEELEPPTAEEPPAAGTSLPPKPQPGPEPPKVVIPGEITPGGGDGVGEQETAAGGGDFVFISDMTEPDAWAAVNSHSNPFMLQMYLYVFPDGAHAAEAERRYSELTNAAGPPSPGPEPVTPPPDTPAETTLARHPMIDAPDSVVALETFTVSVALTEEDLTPEATARAAPTTSLTPEGALAFALPAKAEEWPIDIDLLAPGFELADGGKWGQRVTLYQAGDSDIARFELKARAGANAGKPRQLMARFYHEGRFLGSASRPISVLREAEPAGASVAAPSAGLMMSVAASPPAEMLSSTTLIGDRAEVPDLDVTVHYNDPDNLGSGLIFLHSPHISAPIIAEFTTPAGMTEWLNSEYLRLVDLGLRLRGAEPALEIAGARGAKSLAAPAAEDQASQKEFIAKVAEGFGDDLYRNYVPQPFKDLFWSLKQRGLVHSIQITSNSPVLPWELVRPQAAEGALSDGFLGISYRLARWAPRASVSQLDQPLNRMSFTGVATVAPAYDNNLELPFQQTEIAALSKLAGFRLIGGDFSAFQKMVGEVSTGFIHFSGHGEVNDPGIGAPVFAIRLADQSLDPTTWRALTFAPHDKGNPFYFFNACDTGRAASLGGFVQGWGPAILASGASGFIGGMWPLTDRTAASFSTEFYGGLTGHLAEGPVYLAEVLQGVRKRFYETGDPTYLAYTFYGNANLQVVAQ